ncbi:uncharacterized protein [Dysidea avara]|uniref:uncharacterized protein n=1 Tax=Dysidea avara TaxID=196820 RepID=UPI00331B8367
MNQSSEELTIHSKRETISMYKALFIPGVLEFSLAHFFAKMVSYSFLLWLPFYIKNNEIGGHCLDTFQSGAMAATFDVGGMIGSIGAGLLSDILNARAVAVTVLLYLSIPMIFTLRKLGSANLPLAIILVFLTGVTVVGPHSVITSAVSADLGTHKSLKGNTKAKSTVTGLINGIGSMGAAFGPLITGALSSHEGWDAVFYLFMSLYFASSLLLTRLVISEVRKWRRPCYQQQSNKKTARILHNSDSESVSLQETEFAL